MTPYVLYALPIVLSLTVLVLALRALSPNAVLSWLAVGLAVASVALAVMSVVIVRDVVTGIGKAVEGFSKALDEPAPTNSPTEEQSSGDPVAFQQCVGEIEPNATEVAREAHIAGCRDRAGY